MKAARTKQQDFSQYQTVYGMAGINFEPKSVFAPWVPVSSQSGENCADQVWQQVRDIRCAPHPEGAS
jgi:hypothetical protein